MYGVTKFAFPYVGQCSFPAMVVKNQWFVSYSKIQHNADTTWANADMNAINFTSSTGLNSQGTFYIVKDRDGALVLFSVS